MSRKNYTNGEISLIIDMWSAGASTKEIADAVGRNKTAIALKIYELREEFGPDAVPYRHAPGNSTAIDVCACDGRGDVKVTKTVKTECCNTGSVNYVFSRSVDSKLGPEIVRLYNTGMSSPKIADKLGLTAYEINNYIVCARRAGLDIEKHHTNALTDEDASIRNNTIVDLFKSGKTAEEIVSIIGTTPTIVRAARDAAIERGDLDEHYRLKPKLVYMSAQCDEIDKEMILVLWNSGFTEHMIASKLHRGKGTVYNTLKEWEASGVDVRRQRHCVRYTSGIYTKERIKERVMEMWNSGKTAKTIAEELNLKESYVRNTTTRCAESARKYKCLRCTSTLKNEDTHKKILEMLQSGMGLRSIATELSVSCGTIYNFMNKCDWTLCGVKIEKRRRTRKDKVGGE